MATHHLRTFLVLAALALGGCVGAPSSAGSNSTGLLEIDSGIEPLASLPDDEWQEAPAGCEDRLDSGRLTFLLASVHDHLVAVVDSDGDIVCVDTIESVQEELEELGDEKRAHDLGDRFLVALTIAGMPDPASFLSVDPTPQPNSEFSAGPKDLDPTPQPNDGRPR